MAAKKAVKKEECGDNCDCNHNHQQISMQQIVEHNHILLNAMIGVLLEKKLISEQDIKAKLKEMGIPQPE
jgi:hypothetical protein